MCRLSWNLRASTSWNPQGLSSPVMGLLFLRFPDGHICFPAVPFCYSLRMQLHDRCYYVTLLQSVIIFISKSSFLQFVFNVKFIGHTNPPPNFSPSKCSVFADLWSCEVKLKVKQRACYRPRGFQQVEAPRLGGTAVSPTHRPSLPPGATPGTNFYYTLSQPQGHGIAGRILSMKNLNDPIGNRTRDLPASSDCNLSKSMKRNPKRLFCCRNNELRFYKCCKLATLTHRNYNYRH
jgi:hypothetical protein